MIALYLTRRPG